MNVCVCTESVLRIFLSDMAEVFMCGQVKICDGQFSLSIIECDKTFIGFWNCSSILWIICNMYLKPSICITYLKHIREDIEWIRFHTNRYEGGAGWHSNEGRLSNLVRNSQRRCHVEKLDCTSAAQFHTMAPREAEAASMARAHRIHILQTRETPTSVIR